MNYLINFATIFLITPLTIWAMDGESRYAQCEAFWSSRIEQTQRMLASAWDALDTHTDEEEALAQATPHNFSSFLSKLSSQTRADKESWIAELSQGLDQLRTAKKLCFEVGLLKSQAQFSRLIGGWQ